MLMKIPPIAVNNMDCPKVVQSMLQDIHFPEGVVQALPIQVSVKRELKWWYTSRD